MLPHSQHTVENPITSCNEFCKCTIRFCRLPQELHRNLATLFFVNLGITISPFLVLQKCTFMTKKVKKDGFKNPSFYITSPYYTLAVRTICHGSPQHSNTQPYPAIPPPLNFTVQHLTITVLSHTYTILRNAIAILYNTGHYQNGTLYHQAIPYLNYSVHHSTLPKQYYTKLYHTFAQHRITIPKHYPAIQSLPRHTST